MLIKPSDLNHIALLADLTEPEKVELLSSLQVRQFKRNEVVVHKGQPSSELFFLLAGRLKVVDYSADGREIGFMFIDAGAHFGELALIDGKPRSASIIATETSIVALLPSVAARKLMYSVPSVSEKLLKQLASIIRQANDHIVMLGNGSAYSRICILLRKYAITRPDGVVLIKRLPTQNEIAIMTNTTRETVSRTLSQLIERGHIAKSGKQLIILSMDALESACAE